MQARYQLCAQLLVRFGIELPSHVTGDISIAPAIIDKTLLSGGRFNLNVYQIAWWDEVHIRQCIGETKECIYEFSRDEKGLYKKDGVISKKTKVSLYLFLRN